MIWSEYYKKTLIIINIIVYIFSLFQNGIYISDIYIRLAYYNK